MGTHPASVAPEAVAGLEEDPMNPSEAAQARELALREVSLGLSRLSSHEVDPASTTARGLLYSYQARLRAIEQAEEQAGRQRHAEDKTAAAFRRDQTGRFAPGAQPVNRGEATAPPLTEEQRIAATMQQLAAKGYGRL